MFTADRESCRVGGLLMYVDDPKLNSSICADMMNTDFKESPWCLVETEVEEGKILIGLCYRSTSTVSVTQRYDQ